VKEIKEDLFLTKQSQEKLALFRKIIQTKQQENSLDDQQVGKPSAPLQIEDLNLHTVATLMHKNYGTLYYAYLRLVADLQMIVGDPQASRAKLFAVSEGQLRLALVRQGVPFAFLQHLIAEDLPNFEAFIQAVGYSRVTCLRYLRPLRDMAKNLGLRIVYENLHIIGDEENIRIFLTLAYWLATDGVEWPFSTCSRSQALTLAHQIDQGFKLAYHSPVMKEVLAYFAAVTRVRLAHGHRFSELVTMIADPVPNLFKKQSALTWPEQISESQHLYLVSFLLPMYYAPGDPQIRVMIQRFEHFSPKAFALAQTILGELQPQVSLIAHMSGAFADVIMASMLAIIVGVMTLGFDLGTTIAYAFKPYMNEAQPDKKLQRLVTQATAKALAQVHIDVQGDLLPDLSTALYANLLQLQRIMQPTERVKVALMLEPVALGFLDLVVFLHQQPAVEFLHHHYEEADLIIKDSSVPLVFEHAQHPVVFKWNLNATGDLFGELTTVIKTLQQQKNG
jgi:hypothetical protein